MGMFSSPRNDVRTLYKYMIEIQMDQLKEFCWDCCTLSGFDGQGDLMPPNILQGLRVEDALGPNQQGLGIRRGDALARGLAGRAETAFH